MDQRFEDATALAGAISAGELSAAEAFEHCAERFEALNSTLNAIIHPRLEQAQEQAQAQAAAAASPSTRSPDTSQPQPLAGVPIAVKDLGCDQLGEPHHRGSKFLAQAGWREPQDSFLFQRLSAAGAVSIGRTNTPEFGSTITTEPLHYGATANPWNLDYSPGGSSGGSAAAVAAGIVPVAHGNDGGGSIRIPASACGLVGLKPSRGRVSVGPRLGEHSGGLAADGMLTRTVRDAALCMDIISAPVAGDPYTAPHPQAAFLSRSSGARSSGGARLKIAAFSGRCSAPIKTTVDAAAGLLADLGHEVTPDSYPGDWFDPEMGDHLQVVRSIGIAAQLAYWAKRVGQPVGEEDVEPSNWWAAELGRSLPGSAYVTSLGWLAQWRRRVAQFWAPGQFDLFLTPVLADVTPQLGDLSDPVEGSRRLHDLLGFVDQANATGQPAISLPTAMVDVATARLPVGVQLTAAYGGEALLLDVAQQVSDAGGFVALPDLFGPDLFGPDLPGGQA